MEVAAVVESRMDLVVRTARGLLAFLFSSALSVASDDIDSFQVRAYYTVRLMAFACWTTSCVVGVFYVRLITRAANTSTSAELMR
jgi:hypothetical protein